MNNAKYSNVDYYRYTYDHAKRLTGVTGTDVSSFTCNGLGDRYQQIINSATTTYQLDLAAGLVNVLADGENTYLYGNTIIAQVSNTQTGYYLPDVLGSVRQMTSPTGEVQLSQRFTPFGEVKERYGDGEANFGYAAQKYDAQTGLLYLRARYYAPGTGRFISHDTWSGDANMPMSYNAWLYGYGNPVNLIDVNGMFVTYVNYSVQEMVLPNYSTNYLLAEFDESNGKFTEDEKRIIDSALWDIAKTYARAYNSEMMNREIPCDQKFINVLFLRNKIDPVSAFRILHDGRKVKFTKFLDDHGWWANAESSSEVYVWKEGTLMNVSYDEQRYRRFIVHEMGHVFEWVLFDTTPLNQRLGRNKLDSEYKDLLTKKSNVSPDRTNGFAGGTSNWQWRLDYQQLKPGEIYADMFLGWVYNRWAETVTLTYEGNDPSSLTSLGKKRAKFMDDYMPNWIYNSVRVRLGEDIKADTWK